MPIVKYYTAQVCLAQGIAVLGNNPLIDRLLDLGCCLIYLCLRIQIQLSLSRKRPSTADMISRPNEPLESASGAPQRSNGTQLVL